MPKSEGNWTSMWKRINKTLSYLTKLIDVVYRVPRIYAHPKIEETNSQTYVALTKK